MSNLLSLQNETLILIIMIILWKQWNLSKKYSGGSPGQKSSQRSRISWGLWNSALFIYLMILRFKELVFNVFIWGNSYKIYLYLFEVHGKKTFIWFIYFLIIMLSDIMWQRHSGECDLPLTFLLWLASPGGCLGRCWSCPLKIKNVKVVL